MKNHRFAVTGLVVFAAASLALAGCSASTKTTDNPSASTSPSAAGLPTADPSATLVAAFATLTNKGFDFSETLGSTAADQLNGTGTVNPLLQAASIVAKGTTQGIAVEFDVIEHGSNLFVKVDAGALNATVGLPSTWMTVDSTKITNSTLPVDVKGLDLLDLSTLFTSVTSLKYTDATTIAGIVDLTKSTGALTPDVSKYAAQAATTPFTVKLDSAGNLASINVDTSGYDKTSTILINISNVGTPSTVGQPDGPTTPAPDSAYTFLNSN